MSSISVTTDRSTLLAEARADWLQRAQSKADRTGAKAGQVPSDTELIAEDALLAEQIKRAEAAAEAIALAAQAAQAATPTDSTSLNVLA